jgi:hypothetical protein
MIFFHPRLPVRDIARFCIVQGYDVRCLTRYRADGSRIILTLAVPVPNLVDPLTDSEDGCPDIGDYIDFIHPE